MVRRLQGWVSWRQRAVSQGPPAPESTVQPRSTPRSCLPSAAGPPAVRVQGQHGAPHADGAIPHFRAVWWLAVPWNAALLRDSSICKKVFFQQSYAVRGSDLPSSLTLSYPRYLVISPHTKYICELKKKKTRIKCQRWKEFQPLGWLWKERQVKEQTSCNISFYCKCRDKSCHLDRLISKALS